MDHEQSISPWESFSNVAITDKYIQFNGTITYLIPIKSIENQDFLFIQNYLSERFGG